MDILDKVKSIIKRNDKVEKTIDMSPIRIFNNYDIEEIKMATDKINDRRMWNLINSEIECSVRAGKNKTKVWFNHISDKELNNAKEELIKFGFEVKKIEREMDCSKGLFVSWERKEDEEIKKVN